MRRIETKTKGKITDQNGKSFDGFVQRDPRGGEQSTNLSDNWCNNLQEEICNVIEGVGGQIVSGSDAQVEKYDQMFQAIKLLVDAVTPIGSVKAMSVKMTENIAKWVPIDENDDDDASIIGTEGTAYLSKEMAKNCEQVDGNKAGWYKLISINKENGEPSAVSGWALADGTFPLPLKPFGEDEGPRPPEERNFRHDSEDGPKVEGELISDTEYGKVWRYKHEGRYYLGDSSNLDIKTDAEIRAENRPLIRGRVSDFYDIMCERSHVFNSDWTDSVYFPKEEDLLPPKDDTPIDLRIWTAKNTKKPKLIPNLNDKTFLMGSNEENLPLTVEGKNIFIMKPHHMPPHSHIMSQHRHNIPSSSAAGGYYDEGGNNYLRTSALTNIRYVSNIAFFNTDYSHARIPTGVTGGYYIYPNRHNKKGDMQDKDLYGTVPIDLRPKRLAVYYYIRVI